MSKARILVVDDDKLVLMGFQKILKEAGYDVKTTQSGKEAIEIVKNEKFDLVYTDMKMPEMNGADVCKGIKEISPELTVVLFSGSPRGVADKQFDFLMCGGIDKYIRKPLSSAEIIKTTEELLSKKDKDPNLLDEEV